MRLSRLTVALVLALAVPAGARRGVAGRGSASGLAVGLRGGSSATAVDAEVDSDAEVRWRLEQLNLRQQRLGLLSRSLNDCGVPLPSLSAGKSKEPVRKQWTCRIGEDEEPTSCLIMGEVSPGWKAVSPEGSSKWVTLWELNKMRRNEPEKITGLWYNQYLLNCADLNRHAGPPGMLLHAVLSRTWTVRSMMAGALIFSLFVLGKPLYFCLVRLLSSSFLWHYYPIWCQVVYYPFLVKLAIAGFLWRRVISVNLAMLEGFIRTNLVELECEMLETCVPVDDGPNQGDL